MWEYWNDKNLSRSETQQNMIVRFPFIHIFPQHSVYSSLLFQVYLTCKRHPNFCVPSVTVRTYWNKMFLMLFTSRLVDVIFHSNLEAKFIYKASAYGDREYAVVFTKINDADKLMAKCYQCEGTRYVVAAWHQMPWQSNANFNSWQQSPGNTDTMQIYIFYSLNYLTS